jgi:hypothetical protein
MRGIGRVGCVILAGIGGGCAPDGPAPPAAPVEAPMPDGGDGLFTPAAQDLFRAAAATARRLGHHGVIGTDDLVVTFLTDPRFRPPGVPDLDAEAVFQAAGAVSPPFGQPAEDARPPLRSPKLMEAINRAVDARLAGREGLAPGHLWAGLLLHNSEAVQAILGRVGLDRQALLKAAGLD